MSHSKFSGSCNKAGYNRAEAEFYEYNQRLLARLRNRQSHPPKKGKHEKKFH